MEHTKEKQESREKNLFKDKGKDFETNYLRNSRVYETWFGAESRDFTHGDDSLYEFFHFKKMFAPPTKWHKLHYLKWYLWCAYDYPQAKFPLTIEYLKSLSKKHQPKKAKVFEVSGEKGLKKYWMIEKKINKELLFTVMSLGAVFVANRSKEISQLTLGEVIIDGEEVEFAADRAKGERITQRFVIPPSIGAGSIFQQYIELAHPERDLEARFFRNIHSKSLNFFKSPTGKNYWTDCARAIATWLGFEDPENYSSHSFRATSVTAMAENGATQAQMMLHGNWKSPKIMQGYIRQTKRFRRENTDLIAGSPQKMRKVDPPPAPAASPAPSEAAAAASLFCGCSFEGAHISIVVNANSSTEKENVPTKDTEQK